MSQTHTRRSTINKSSVSYEVNFASSLKKIRVKDKESMKPKTILQFSKVPVVYDGVDVTPVSLNPYLYEGSKERQIGIMDALTKETSFMVQQQRSVSRVDSQKFQTNLFIQRQEVENVTFGHRSIVTSQYFGDDIVIPPASCTSRVSEASSRGTMLETESLPEHVVEIPIPEHISLVLTETETIFLMDIPSCTVLRGSEEADLVEEDNKHYDFLTKGKGRNRKVFSVGVQTIPILKKARDTETEKLRRKNCSTYVSVWEMYDTFQKMEPESSDEESGDEIASLHEQDDDSFGLLEHKLNDESSVDSYRASNEDKQLNKIVKSKTFQDALIVTERILGNNCYNTQQKRFKGLSDPDVFRENIEYKYTLELLWTYSNEQTTGRCVTALAFNDSNEDIVAVAYGKYFYNDRNCSGMVLIWNIKNPQQPERHYDFLFPVTSISFSKLNPNLLAIGFYNGHMKILDVSKRENIAIREDKAFFEPVWSVIWFQQGDEEDIMVGYGDGRICRYQMTSAQHLKRTQIMMTAAAEGKLKGIKYLKKCESKGISITGYDQARCLIMHPNDSFTYFVGTSEGVVHRCSTNYYNEHMDLFKSHEGAVHTIRFSPFANKLFYTCGDDSRSRLWADGIAEPLITSSPSIVPVLDGDWSPGHPTVIATIRGTEILVWDLQRKMHQSQSVKKSANNVFNTVCRFTTNGRCLMVGDMAGNVHVYSLEDMPIPPFFPENLISQSLKKLLVTKPDLLKKLRKLGSLTFDKQKVSKFFS